MRFFFCCYWPHSPVLVGGRGGHTRGASSGSDAAERLWKPHLQIFWADAKLKKCSSTPGVSHHPAALSHSWGVFCPSPSSSASTHPVSRSTEGEGNKREHTSHLSRSPLDKGVVFHRHISSSHSQNFIVCVCVRTDTLLVTETREPICFISQSFSCLWFSTHPCSPALFQQTVLFNGITALRAGNWRTGTQSVSLANKSQCFRFLFQKQRNNYIQIFKSWKKNCFVFFYV